MLCHGEACLYFTSLCKNIYVVATLKNWPAICPRAQTAVLASRSRFMNDTKHAFYVLRADPPAKAGIHC